MKRYAPRINTPVGSVVFLGSTMSPERERQLMQASAHKRAEQNIKKPRPRSVRTWREEEAV